MNILAKNLLLGEKVSLYFGDKIFKISTLL